MTDTVTRRLITLYEQMADPTLFLSGFFQSPPINFHTSKEVEVDIMRTDEDVAVVLQDESLGYRSNSLDIYTNKSFVPPAYKELITLNSFDLLKRMPGSNPFEAPDFRANAMVRVLQGIRKVEDKIRRAVEIQASQVLQTGQLNLLDKGGNTIFDLDYAPKATHFPTSAVSWATATGQQMRDDIENLGEVVRDDGLRDPELAIMGTRAFSRFINNSDNRAAFDNRRIDVGEIIRRRPMGAGASLRGVIDIGNYSYAIWTYAGRYKDPQTGNKLRFLDQDKVIVMSSDARLDLTWGAIPNLAKEMGVGGDRLLPELPARLPVAGANIDLFINAWLDKSGENLYAGVGSRPLCIPTAIDQFGCLDTVP